MLFRPQRGSLSAAMRACVTIHGLADIDAIIAPDHVVDVKPYPGPEARWDARIGWHTYIVLGTHGPVGFTNGPIDCEPERR